MKDLFDATLVQETTGRARQLRPDSIRQWGRMELPQTLAHCTSAIEMAMGRIRARRARFPANVLGLLIKPLVLRDDKPMRRESPSAPELFSSDSAGYEFTVERERLIAAIERFAAEGPAGCTDYPHSFFGRLTPEQWALLMYKHVDHHLRQFGA